MSSSEPMLLYYFESGQVDDFGLVQPKIILIYGQALVPI
jgi:hypothetical protein